MPLAEGSHKAPIENQYHVLLAQVVSQLKLVTLKIRERKCGCRTGVLI
jgi:hypothetical protein